MISIRHKTNRTPDMPLAEQRSKTRAWIGTTRNYHTVTRIIVRTPNDGTSSPPSEKIRSPDPTEEKRNSPREGGSRTPRAAGPGVPPGTTRTCRPPCHRRRTRTRPRPKDGDAATRLGRKNSPSYRRFFSGVYRFKLEVCLRPGLLYLFDTPFPPSPNSCIMRPSPL